MPLRVRSVSATAVAAITLIAMLGAAVWWVEPTLHRDAAIHLCWLQSFSDAVREGVWWPAWSHRDFSGLGAPVFVYYPPLAYVLGTLALSAGAEPGTALRAVYALSTALLALTAAGWIAPRHCGATRVCLVAGLLFLPTVVLVGWRYNMPAAALALAFAAFCLWQLERLIRGARGAVALLALGLVLSAATHVITTVQLLLLLGLALTVALVHPVLRPRAWPLAAAIGLGVMLSAPLWWPAVSQWELVRGDALLQTKAAPTADMLLFSGAEVLQRWPERRIIEVTGLALLVLLLAAWGPARRERSQAAAMRLLLVLALCCAGLASVVSAPLYLRVPGLDHLQFGWRWVGLFSLLVWRILVQAWPPSHPAGSPATAWSAAAGVTLAACAGVGAGWMFNLDTPWSRAPAPVSHDDLRIQAATCPVSPPEYLPRAVSDAQLRALLAAPASTPFVDAPHEVLSHRRTSHTEMLEIRMQAAGDVRLARLWHPWWRVTVDGESRPLHSGDARVSFEVEPGHHRIEARFDAAAARQPPLAVTAALLPIGLLVWRWRRRTGGHPR